MSDEQHSTAATNLVAIDIAQDWNVALVQDASGRRQRFKFANRSVDHDHFVQFLHSLFRTSKRSSAAGAYRRLSPEHRAPAPHREFRSNLALFFSPGEVSRGERNNAPECRTPETSHPCVSWQSYLSSEATNFVPNL